MLEPVHRQQPVRELRHRVVVSQALKVFLGLSDCGQVGEDGDIVGEPVALAGDRCHVHQDGKFPAALAPAADFTPPLPILFESPAIGLE